MIFVLDDFCRYKISIDNSSLSVDWSMVRLDRLTQKGVCAIFDNV